MTKRYKVPMNGVPGEVGRAALELAASKLSSGSGTAHEIAERWGEYANRMLGAMYGLRPEGERDEDE